MKVLFITTGMLTDRSRSNSYQESLFDAFVNLGHQVSVLCTATIGRKFEVQHSINPNGLQIYRIINGGIYPGVFPQGGVGTTAPIEDIRGSNRLRSMVTDVVEATSPDLISIQGLMGLPLESIVDLRLRGYPTILTAHDYFALCPTAHLFKTDLKPCYLKQDELVCSECCTGSLTFNAFRRIEKLGFLIEASRGKVLFQTPLQKMRGLVLRSDRFIVRLRKKRTKGQYGQRRAEAIDVLKSLTTLHCISNVQANVYQELAGPMPNLRIVPLQSPAVQQIVSIPRVPRNDNLISFAALNVSAEMKGGTFLTRVAGRLQASGRRFRLDFYGPMPNSFLYSEDVRYHGRYTLGDLDSIAGVSDFCIIPSTWNETLGFTAMEMLARGVPVLVSKRAGASEFVDDEVNGYIFDPDNDEGLFALMCRIIDEPLLAASVRMQLANGLERFKNFAQHVTEMEILFGETIAKVRHQTTAIEVENP